MNKTLFIILLIVLAASPISILGHELWHIGFSYFYGARPAALCVAFDNAIAISLIDMSEVTVDMCYIHFIDELVAYAITIGVVLLMVYIFTRKYISLLGRVKDGHAKTQIKKYFKGSSLYSG